MDIKELAKADYLNGMKYKDISTKHRIPESTIKSWKSRGKWAQHATKTKKVAKKVASKKVVAAELTETVVTGSLHGQDVTEKEVDLRTLMAGGKEITKRYPANDVLLSAKLRKLEAEADIAGYRALEVINSCANQEYRTIVNDFGGNEDD